MKRILHIIPSLVSGGAERQLTNIVCNTAAAEFSHYVCTLAEAEFFAPQIREAGHEVRELKAFGKHKWLSGAAKLLPEIRRYRPDLIVTWLFDANIVGRLVCFLSPGIPLITTLHSLDYEPETIRSSGWSPSKVEFFRQVDQLTARFAAPHFAACSHIVKKSYQKRLKIADERIKVIYNGIDPNSLDCEPNEPQRLRQALEIPDDAFIYTSVGKMFATKNQSILLRNFGQVIQSVPQAYLTLVGTGPLEQELLMHSFSRPCWKVIRWLWSKRCLRSFPA
jgi:glycosyltransferase involved in cell wall biosynthesis